ncbi:hypothetical protein PAPYR_1617 [Paratrimastix pyriformis]|uniref:Uncharacterized protein n=1 Tax=Paratrimastix pyriformis TaxID=342808 RepID=A0ABQ8USW2_9EUKA|nr:hypothetical protein PAPYR_1617 [Paratrimastix pyriformis]
MLDEFCKLFGHLGFSSGALPSSTLLKGIIESLQKGCSPAVSRDRIAVWIQKLLSSFMWQCYLKYRDDAPPSHSRHSSASSTDDSSDPPTSPECFPTRTHQRGGDRDVSIPDSPFPRPFTLTEARGCKGVRLALGQEGCAHGGDLHTEVACLPACPGGDAAPPPPAASVPAPQRWMTSLKSIKTAITPENTTFVRNPTEQEVEASKESNKGVTNPLTLFREDILKQYTVFEIREHDPFLDTVSYFVDQRSHHKALLKDARKRNDAAGVKYHNTMQYCFSVCVLDTWRNPKGSPPNTPVLISS